mmetsp:Transcript_14274/g.44604  ORF Transcript_14274/g.44604 Transcript_14274/m.44604 type:complete len:397 (+) Transcript_14274:188-1378(+)
MTASTPFTGKAWCSVSITANAPPAARTVALSAALSANTSVFCSRRRVASESHQPSDSTLGTTPALASAGGGAALPVSLAPASVPAPAPCCCGSPCCCSPCRVCAASKIISSTSAKQGGGCALSTPSSSASPSAAAAAAAVTPSPSQAVAAAPFACGLAPRAPPTAALSCATPAPAPSCRASSRLLRLYSRNSSCTVPAPPVAHAAPAAAAAAAACGAAPLTAATPPLATKLVCSARSSSISAQYSSSYTLHSAVARSLRRATSSRWESDPSEPPSPCAPFPARSSASKRGSSFAPSSTGASHAAISALSAPSASPRAVEGAAPSPGRAFSCAPPPLPPSSGARAPRCGIPPKVEQLGLSHACGCGRVAAPPGCLALPARATTRTRHPMRPSRAPVG